MIRMRIYYSFLLSIIICFPLNAQDNVKPFSFPHKTGDMWEYFYDDYSPMYVDTLQNFTIFDSIEFNGIIFMRQHAQFINPIASPVILGNTTKYWIDTVNHYVYSNLQSGYDSLLVYKLKAKVGEQWILAKGGNYNIARINKKWEGTIFGKNTTFMSITYYFVLVQREMEKSVNYLRYTIS